LCFPFIEFALELSDLENPFLPGQHLEGTVFPNDQKDVAGCHDYEFAQRVPDFWESFAERFDAAANALHGDAGVDESLRGFDRNEIGKVVTVVAAFGLRRRNNKAGLRPVLKLASRDA
jgi:hypothetical protein